MKNRDITFATILLALGFLALSPMAQAVVPAPDGAYPGGNTAEGQSALLSHTTGLYNTAVGIYSLLSLTDSNIWPDSEPLDVSERAAGSVTEKCSGADSRVAINCVVTEREKTIGCVIAAGDVALERSAATSRIAKASGVVK